MNSTTLLAVAGGGAVGAVLRYSMHSALTHWHGGFSAWSTLAVNSLGSLLLGVAAGLLLGRTGVLSPFLMIGVLGAFTTFSTFAMDAVLLFRDRGLGLALLYVVASVVVSILAFAAGWLVSKGSTA